MNGKHSKTAQPSICLAAPSVALANAGVQMICSDSHGLIRVAPQEGDAASYSYYNAMRKVHANDRAALSDAIRKARDVGNAACVVRLSINSDEMKLHRLGLHYCAKTGWSIVIVDLSEEQQRINELEQNEEHLRNIVEYNPQLPWIADPEGNIIDFTDRWLNSTGMTREEAAGAGWLAATHPDDIERVNENVSTSLRLGRPFDVRVRLEVSGEYRWMRAQGYPQHDDNGQVIRWYGYTEDIHESVLVEQQIRWNAEHDALTGLPNRSLFSQRLAQACEDALKSLCKVGALMVDLDNFKDVNDLMGHHAGDELLCAFADSLLEIAPEGTTVARLGGDEFGILMPQIDTIDELVELGERFLDFDGTVSTSGRRIQCRASVGACVFPDHGTNATTIMRQADLALYRAKSLGRAQLQVFEKSMLREMQERVAMVNRARSAVRERSVLTYYQPKVSLASGRLCGFEALLRWRDNNGNISLPGEIYAAFDDPEVADLLGQTMVDQIFDDIVTWRERDVDIGSVAINVSGAEIQRAEFVPRLLANIERAGLAPDDIEIELTEGIFLGAGAEAARGAINMLNEAKVPMALDDFGTGFASLSHLRMLPVKTLKIDRSFVNGISRSQNDSAIVTAIVALGQAMNLTVVAEGVETLEQALILRDRGCEVGQGYYFGRPTPSELIPEFVERWPEGIGAGHLVSDLDESRLHA